jgi:type VI secretion system protein ImpC
MGVQEKDSQVQGEAIVEESGLLDQILQEGRIARDENQKVYGRDLIGEFVKQIMEGSIVVSKDTELMINSRIAQIDKLISA